MRKLLNTLYVSTQGAYLHKDGETVIVEVNKEKKAQYPINAIGSIVCFGNVLCSPFLLGFCASKDVSISFLSERGKFLASVRGAISGNVLLRREQYRKADDPVVSRLTSINIISAKLSNSLIVIHRALRDHGAKINSDLLKTASENIKRLIRSVSSAENVEEARGYEGEGAYEYFNVFNHLILDQKEDFIFTDRNRRPPLDNINALLSFIYTILTHDVRSALETVGLDPQVGFLHRDRSGRHSLALDMIEEFRPVIADRLVLSLINRRQVNKKDFTKSASGAVTMSDDARKTILVEYQNRKQEEIYHPYIEEKVKIGQLFFLQSNLLARYIRGDLDAYPPFFWK
ncbi:MAG: type I-C CRISPR-associated endonuclease Cas1c [Helicobacteraceae bacterium]|jgi:CRISPR-associated protein Cas1|nr:type I-C CRISPR-associated endonuclease Cas1c [Helicobacteraceae bacterium]